MGEIAKTAVEATGGMSVGTFLAIIAALVTVITALGEVIKSQVQKRTNPLNGTLVKLNDTLIKIDMRTGDSVRALEGHTEKLIMLGSTMAQLAANEAQQTEVLRSLGPMIQDSITGSANRITEHCNARSASVLAALDRQG